MEMLIGAGAEVNQVNEVGLLQKKSFVLVVNERLLERRKELRHFAMQVPPDLIKLLICSLLPKLKLTKLIR